MRKVLAARCPRGAGASQEFDVNEGGFKQQNMRISMGGSIHGDIKNREFTVENRMKMDQMGINWDDEFVGMIRNPMYGK